MIYIHIHIVPLFISKKKRKISFTINVLYSVESNDQKLHSFLIAILQQQQQQNTIKAKFNDKREHYLMKQNKYREIMKRFQKKKIIY